MADEAAHARYDIWNDDNAPPAPQPPPGILPHILNDQYNDYVA